MKKPVIGIVPLIDDVLNRYWMLPNYMVGVEQAGGLPLILDVTKDRSILSQEAGLCDGILFTGGEDIHPSMYNEMPLLEDMKFMPVRDAMESLLMHQMLVRNKPLLGICRGHQLLNVVLNGTLYQDLLTQHPGSLQHRQTQPHHLPCHKVYVQEGTPLHDVLKRTCIEVNSLHHQGVKDLGSALQTMAVSEDGVVEAVYMPGKKFVWGIQWHPERMLESETSIKIFRSFVDSCKGPAHTRG